MKDNITYSETFYSAQGEGQYIGEPSLWIRFFLCNLQCDGFGQEHPTKPDTWDLPYETVDISHIKVVEDLPVFEKGCDSSYTWAKKFKHLMRTKDVSGLVDELEALLPGGKFKHPVTGLESHMVFTGGEPMLNQEAIVAIMKEFEIRDNVPKFVTVETNGTRKIKPILKEYITEYAQMEHNGDMGSYQWLWSISPKLWSTAGEKAKKAIKPEVIASYINAADYMWCYTQLKFVVNGSQESWDEVAVIEKQVHDLISELDPGSYPWPTTWIMGVGGTLEGLKVTEATIADECLQRGYKYTSRVHCHIYGNAIGK
jgi:7-carboxy-7-deazaguanine synthase